MNSSGQAPKGLYSPTGVAKHLLETPLLRTPSENPFSPLKPTTRHLLGTLLRTFRKPFSEPENWETDFHTPQVLGGTAFFDNSGPAVYKNQGPSGTGFLYTAAAEL